MSTVRAASPCTSEQQKYWHTPTRYLSLLRLCRNRPIRQMKAMLDNLEKSLTFVSPVKDGLGVSTLDRTLLCDNRGELFFRKLAALEAEKKSKAARDASGTCNLEPIGEVGSLGLFVEWCNV